MNELISLTQSAINGELQQTVNARELYAFLEVSSRYNDWIRNRISSYEFQENIDYVCLTKTLVTQTEEGREGASTQKEHFITLDTAKELAMVERNDKGKEARRYFIECEKQLKQVTSTKDTLLLNIFKASGDINKALAINAYEEQYVKPLENKVIEQEERIIVLEPKGQFYDAVVQSETLLDIGEVSKLLNYKGLGRNNLFRYLRENSILNNKNLPYQTYIDRGYFKIVESSWVNPSTKLVEVSIKTVMYQKGIDWLDKLLSEHFVKSKD